MKKSILILGCSLISIYGFSQADIANPVFGHQRTNIRYLGWTPGPGSVPGPLDIRNDFNEPINISTNGIQRVLVDNGAGGFAAGRVAMGNNLPNNFAAQDRLHLHQNVRGPLIRFTNNATGSTNTDGFRVGIRGVGVNSGIATLQNFENTPMEFYNNNIQRMHINADNGTTDGFVGIGNNFNNPQSQLHIHNEQATETRLQITNQSSTTTANGLTLGIVDANLFSGSQIVGYLRWDEDSPLIIQTGGPGSPATGQLERIRISGLGSGAPDPFNITGSLTRVGISHDGGEPIDRTRSLLHLGYNTGEALGNINLDDGWRNWMDIGTFTNNSREHVYFGLKQEEEGIISAPPAGGSNQIPIETARYDAIINWGDNEAIPADDRYNILRFIYTTPQTGTVDFPQSQWDGLETMRVEPIVATTLAAPNFGMVGIGNFSEQGPNFGTLDAKLDIDGDLRIREVTQDSTLLQVLVIDSTDHNRVHWRSIADFGGNVIANNGLSNDPLTSDVQLGQEYTGTPLFTGPSSLITDREIPLRNRNLHFTGLGTENSNIISIGRPNTTNESSKLFVTNYNQDAGAYIISDGQGASFQSFYGVKSVVQNYNSDLGVGVFALAQNAAGNNSKGVGVYALSKDNYVNFGIEAVVNSNNPNTNTSYAGYFKTSGYGTNICGIYAEAPNNGVNRAGKFNGDVEIINGVLISDQMFKTDVENIKDAVSILKKLRPHTYIMNTTGFPQFNFSDKNQFGFIAQEIGEVLPDLVYESYMPSELDSLGNEIYPAVNYKSLNYNALIPITVQAVNEITDKIDKATLSDQNVKTNVQGLTNSLDKIKQMRGVSYQWSSIAQNDMNLDSLKHIGFIAQEVATIEPLLTFVDDSNLVHVNYDRVVPILVESVKELDNIILTKDSVIDNLEDRLSALEECIRAANICITGNRISNPDAPTTERSIELTNVNSIILDQNLPNPFAENTVITYNIPEDVNEAKLLFYDLNGRVIKEMIIEERGESKLTVYGENLKTGVYTYSLIVDSKLISTKKMVKQ
ncbi:MAG: tail fiber domain-containing protein [Flavobacteriales bacterium]|nr:tail fiber domain-containing protein [Flavobacteriales bacterium]MCB9363605.1 tail fiber domain-containing protein [Flavobacteriales bacterium]